MGTVESTAIALSSTTPFSSVDFCSVEASSPEAAGAGAAGEATRDEADAAFLRAIISAFSRFSVSSVLIDSVVDCQKTDEM